MISKSNFSDFLEKCYLNKTVENFVLNVNDNQLSCDIKASTSLLGSIVLNNFDCDDCKIGVYNPDVLIKMLSILNDDTNITVNTKKGSETVSSIVLKDKKAKQIKYVTQDLEIFDIVEKKKAKVSEYEVRIQLNSEVIDDFLKAKGCIDSSKVAFTTRKNKTIAIFGYSSNNVNQIELEFESEEADDIDTLLFNSDVLKEILSVNNKRFEEATIEISLRGIMRVYFKGKLGNAEYYLIKLQDEVE